ncbi:UNVERIFIED_ORG: putative DNA-binding WGR domain protein [Arthrobacter sp. UYCu721]
MTSPTNITIQEAAYIDPRSGNDKFYRTFAFGSAWATQYGRNGTVGAFTKIIEAASPEAAQQAADAKFLSKIKKGYNPVRSGTVSSPTELTADNLAFLDELAQSLPLGTSSVIVSQPANAVDLGQRKADDLTESVATALNASISDRPAMHTDIYPDLPVRPMLASVQSAEIISTAINDPSWVAQYKYDGDRVVVEITHGEIRVLNRQGEEKSKNVGTAHLLPFSALHAGRWVFDGEIVGRTLVLFDLIAASDAHATWVQEHDAFSRRYCALTEIANVLSIPAVAVAPHDAPVVLAPVATGNAAKDHFLATAISEQREGIILRHEDGPYDLGRRSTFLVKHKLIKDADVIVTSLHGMKQSASLAVHDVNGKLIEIGSASTIGKGAVAVGDVWVVTFLYVTDPQHPRLFQPRLVSRRHDKLTTDCTIDQFTDAGTSKMV